MNGQQRRALAPGNNVDVRRGRSFENTSDVVDVDTVRHDDVVLLAKPPHDYVVDHSPPGELVIFFTIPTAAGGQPERELHHCRSCIIAGGMSHNLVTIAIFAAGLSLGFLIAAISQMRKRKALGSTFGVLLSLGMRSWLVSLMVYTESVLLSLVGVLTGLGIGIPVVLFFQSRGIDFGFGDEVMSEYGISAVIHPQLQPLVLYWSVGIVFGMSLLFALYPAVKAARLKPVEALRHA